MSELIVKNTTFTITAVPIRAFLQILVLVQNAPLLGTLGTSNNTGVLVSILHSICYSLHVKGLSVLCLGNFYKLKKIVF